MKRISLHGSYYFNNYGDILLVNIFYKWIKETFPDAEINLPLVDKKKIIDLPDSTTGIINFLHSDALVYCGGGYFGEQPRHKLYWSLRNFKRHAIIGLFAILFKIPYAIIGVEFGPISYKWFKIIVIFLAKHAKVLVVRNEESLKFLMDNGVQNAVLSKDAVLSLVPKTNDDYQNQTHDKLLIHVPCFYLYPERIFQLLDAIIEGESHRNVDFSLEFISDDTYEPYSHPRCNDLIDYLKKKNVKFSFHKYIGCDDLINTIQGASYIFTTKLHVGITAAALNKRVFSLYAHPKTIRFHKQIGNGKFCYAIKDTCNLSEPVLQFLNTEMFLLSDTSRKDALVNKTLLQTFLINI